MLVGLAVPAAIKRVSFLLCYVHLVELFLRVQPLSVDLGGVVLADPAAVRGPINRNIYKIAVHLPSLALVLDDTTSCP